MTGINVDWQHPDPKKFEQLAIDPAMPGAEKAFITMLYPNNTKLTITGDPKIVQQIINRLDGQTIDYEQPQSTDKPTQEKPPWETCHFVERAKHDINILHVDCPVSFKKGERCAIMDYLENASQDELKALLPKIGDYEVTLVKGRYYSKPFPKRKKNA